METKKVQFADASGRGQSGDYRVAYPARMYAYTEAEIQAVVDVLRSDGSLTQAARQAEFEQEFREFTGAGHAFAVSSGTGALWLAGHLAGLRPGDEVIVPAYTFCATAIGVGASGVRIVWADIDPASRTICPKDVERKITPHTKAIIAVHLLGMPCDMDPILEIAKRHGLKVIEDCAQAPGATYKGRRVGSFGDFGCFSFNGAKNMTTMGEGGMLTVKSEDDAAKVDGIRHNGVRGFTGPRDRYWVPAMSNVDLDLEGVWPTKYCLTEAQCALGSALLKRLDQVNDTLRAQYAYLENKLRSCEHLRLRNADASRRHVAHAFVASFDGTSLGKTRDDLMDTLTAQHRIKAIVQYYPLYRFPLFQKMGFGDADCPNLESYWPTSYSYPWWCGMPEETLDYMAEATLSTIAAMQHAAKTTA